MCGLMNVQVEVWPVAADAAGLWLLSDGGPWLSAPIPQDSDPHFEVEHLLGNAAIANPPLLHSTSWRPDGPHVLLTYIAVVVLRNTAHCHHTRNHNASTPQTTGIR